MSFLEVQDLATIAAQTDLPSVFAAWYDTDGWFNALTTAVAACVIAFAIRRAKR